MLTLPMDEALAIDGVVSRALGKVPGKESIEDAAKRVMAAPHGNRAWRVAREVLHGRGEPWSRLRRAAKIARRCGLGGAP